MGTNYLIDTHIFLWWIFNDPQLNTRCRDIMTNPNHQILVSSATAWEIATKYRIGKLPEASSIIANYPSILQQLHFRELTTTSRHAIHAGSLAIEHRDPFDRMIMAQADLENLPIITYDKAFNQLNRLQIIR